jgi:enoyl-CoA hydratase/carnithine racemase
VTERAEVLHTVDAHVATVVLRNERRRNAMSLAMWTALADTLERLQDDAEVRVLVLRGAGERAFVSGADISEFDAQRSQAAGVAAYDAAVDRAQGALARFPRPVIAAISGICYGGGLGLALACDLRYGSATARFRMPAARLGLGYALKGMKRMVDVLGVAHAGELFYTARVVGADEAARIGLLNSVHGDVFAHAAQSAAEIAANAPLTLKAAKLAMQAVLARDAGAEATEAAAAQAVRACFESEDYLEGRRAFAEKRDPRFTGR